MEIRGTILEKTEQVWKTQNFRVQELFLDCSTYDTFSGEKKENILKFQLSNGAIDKFSALNVGDVIRVKFSIQGRFFDYTDPNNQTKKTHMQNLKAYDFEKITFKEKTQPAQEFQSEPSEQTEDGLPF